MGGQGTGGFQRRPFGQAGAGGSGSGFGPRTISSGTDFPMVSAKILTVKLSVVITATEKLHFLIELEKQMLLVAKLVESLKVLVHKLFP